MDFTARLKKKLSSRLLGNREKTEVGSSKSFSRTATLAVPSPSQSRSTETLTSSKSLKPSRPFFRRAASAPVETRATLAAEPRTESPIVVIPAPLPYSPPQPIVRPIVLQMTKGPTILRSNLPRKVPEARPKTSRKAEDGQPPFGHKSAIFPTSASMPAISEMVSSPSTTSITIIPPSPPAAEPVSHETSVIPPSPPARTAPIPPAVAVALDLPATTPVLEQEPIFPSGLAALPSPSSESGPELHTPSPSLGSFQLPQYPVRRPVSSSCIPEETSSNGSPTSIRSRMEPESPVVMTARLVKLPSRATLASFNPARPITLDMTSATRKPNHTRQQASLPGSSSVAGPSRLPASPNYARPLPLERLSPATPRAHGRSEEAGLEVEVEVMVKPETPPPRGYPFQNILDALAAQAREEAGEVEAEDSVVGTAL